jgi:hypothetical protein
MPTHSKSHPYLPRILHVTYPACAPPRNTHFCHYDADMVTQKSDGTLFNVVAVTGTCTHWSHTLPCTAHHIHIPLFKFEPLLQVLWTGIETHVSISAKPYELSVGFNSNVGCYFHLVLTFIFYLQFTKRLSSFFYRLYTMISYYMITYPLFKFSFFIPSLFFYSF